MNKLRWRTGETNQVSVPVKSGEDIEEGSLVYLYENEATTIWNHRFLGVAMCNRHKSDKTLLRVATSGRFECDAPKDRYFVGENIGTYRDDNLSKTILGDNTIGRVARHEPRMTTKIIVDIRSVVMNGGYTRSTLDYIL